MDTLLAVFAAIAAIIGLGLTWWRWRVSRELAAMAATLPTGAGTIAQQPPGAAVSVQGTLRVREALTAEFSGKPAAYYIAEIEREETYYERDSQGREERRTRTTTVYSNMKYGACLVEDTTGKVGIDFDGAKVEAIQTVNEPTAPPSSGSGMLNTVLSALSSGNDRYTRKERILPPDIPIYVLGEVHQGGLIGKPAKGSHNKIFVISHKSEEERAHDLTKTTRWLLGFMLLCFAITAVLLVWAVAKGH